MASVFHHRIVKHSAFTLVGGRGNHKTQEQLSEKIRKNYFKIKDPLIPYSCQVVWSIDHKQGRYDTFLGFVVQSIEDEDEVFEICKLPSNDYAVFEFSGKIDAFVRFLESIYTHWLPSSGYMHHPQDCTHLHFSKQEEKVVNRGGSKEESTNNWEIWIPIKLA